MTIRIFLLLLPFDSVIANPKSVAFICPLFCCFFLRLLREEDMPPSGDVN